MWQNFQMGITSVCTHCFANMSVVFLHVIVTVLTLLLWGFTLSVVSFGIAVNMQDICRAQRPLE